MPAILAPGARGRGPDRGGEGLRVRARETNCPTRLYTAWETKRPSAGDTGMAAQGRGRSPPPQTSERGVWARGEGAEWMRSPEGCGRPRGRGPSKGEKSTRKEGMGKLGERRGAGDRGGAAVMREKGTMERKVGVAETMGIKNTNHRRALRKGSCGGCSAGVTRGQCAFETAVCLQSSRQPCPA